MGQTQCVELRLFHPYFTAVLAVLFPLKRAEVAECTGIAPSPSSGWNYCSLAYAGSLFGRCIPFAWRFSYGEPADPSCPELKDGPKKDCPFFQPLTDTAGVC